MNKKEIINQIQLSSKSKYENEVEFSFFLDHFQVEVEFCVNNIPSLDSQSSQGILLAVMNDILSFNPNSMEWFQIKIWEHFNQSMDSTWFGMVNYEGFENEKEANINHFKIKTAAEAVDSIKLGYVHIHLNSLENRSYQMNFSCPWEMEHGIIIGVLNNQFSYME